MCRMSWKSGSLNLLEPSGPHRAYYGAPVPLRYSNLGCLIDAVNLGFTVRPSHGPWYSVFKTVVNNVFAQESILTFLTVLRINNDFLSTINGSHKRIVWRCCNLLRLNRIDDRRMNEYEALVEWQWQGKTAVLGWKPVLLPLCPPQIPHFLSWFWAGISDWSSELWHSLMDWSS